MEIVLRVKMSDERIQDYKKFLEGTGQTDVNVAEDIRDGLTLEIAGMFENLIETSSPITKEDFSVEIVKESNE